MSLFDRPLTPSRLLLSIDKANVQANKKGFDINDNSLLTTKKRSFLIEGLANGVQGVTDLAVSVQGEPSADYFIGVTGIAVNEKPVALNKTLLSINKEGNGGTKISTVAPYTVMETSIYKAVVEAFTKQIPGVHRVAAVAPFGTCFDARSFGRSRVRPAVPLIDLVLPNTVAWGIFGANSMVQVKNDVLCLGFVDGGVDRRASNGGQSFAV
ncbi:hypothetical protein F3Y22_tig00111769pilonHSYRG00387 [Hibiscus syriacus]|uniref:Xylanase inhibitor C-terminal domain-containing protein n=1 Tax=Hibiscus syriacus TaxID=106335 RepID=A0A6A2Y9U2_HIBSY|nr:hypothetical protein F3Y22_tig00111769pilonHSYRG00387 [Hibiscus syriacus]